MIAHPTTTRAAIARLQQHIAAAEHCADVASHAQNQFAVRAHMRRIAEYRDRVIRLQRHMLTPARRGAVPSNNPEKSGTDSAAR